MNRNFGKQKINKYHYYNPDGAYTLIELAAVVAVLATLAGIAIPQIGNFVGGSKIDSVKAMVNGVAADCLQKSRVSSNTTVDDTIISNKLLESKGYIIDPDNKTCTSFGVKPINDADSLLFPMSFAIVSGKLTKSSQPTGPDSIPYCKSWAGILCTEGEELKKLVNHMAAIQTSKEACDAALAKNKADKITAGPINKWNPNATSGCPTRPPVDTTSSTCTINGCLNNQVWLVEGVEYTSKADADAAEIALAGANCITNLNNLTNANPTLSQAKVRPTDCTKDYYFAEGKRFDNEPAWKTEMCSINIKEKQDAIYTDTSESAPSKVEHCADDRNFYFCAGEDKRNETDHKACLIDNESAACGVEIDEVRKTGGNGLKTNLTKGPSPCGTDFYVCEEVIVTKVEYEEKCAGNNEASCGKAPIAQCYTPDFYDTITCTSATDKTDNWAKCMGFN